MYKSAECYGGQYMVRYTYGNGYRYIDSDTDVDTWVQIEIWI